MMKYFLLWLLVIPMVANSANSAEGTIQVISETVIEKNQPDINQYIGAGSGAVIGYGLGRLLGSSAGIIGGGLGAVIGSSSTNSHRAYAFVINYTNGSKQTIIQRVDRFPKTKYYVGDEVTVVNLNGEYLVVK